MKLEGQKESGIEASSETGDSYASEFLVPKLDCPSEEHMIRMALEGIEPKIIIEFDTPNRKLRVLHRGSIEEAEKRLVSLGLGASRETTQPIDENELFQAHTASFAVDHAEARLLKWLLAINFLMFVVEIVVGALAQSTGLIADSLDMFADAAVYGVALYAVGRTVQLKVQAAHLAGWLQVILALGALSEVFRRFVFGSEPASELMMGFGFVALVANVTCLVLLAKNRDGGAHMKASWIFSANDVIANVGVILAGLLVALTGSRYPDLIIGLIIGVIVLSGARRILKLNS